MGGEVSTKTYRIPSQSAPLTRRSLKVFGHLLSQEVTRRSGNGVLCSRVKDVNDLSVASGVGHLSTLIGELRSNMLVES